MAQTLDLGKVALTLGGNWASNVSYEALTYVLYETDGCGYISLKTNINVTPGTDATTWQKASKAGSSIYELCVKQGTFVGTEAEFVALYNSRLAACQTAATNCNNTNTSVMAAEALRVTAETSRASAESSRATAETNRASAESSRVAAESTRQAQETSRQSASATAVAACNTAKDAADAAATQCQADHTTAVDDHTTAGTDHTTAVADHTTAGADHDLSEELNEHPMRINTTTCTWEKWNTETNQYEDTGIMAMASPYATFEIDTTTGQLVETTSAYYGGPTFSLNQDTGSLLITL